MKFDSDYFELFSLERTFSLNLQKLDQIYQALQKEVHPDRFTQATEKEQRISLQWATRVNEAYQTLKKPLLRAHYLLELAGVSLDLAGNGHTPIDFLEEQIVWREAIDEARTENNTESLENLAAQLDQRMSKEFLKLSASIDDVAQHELSVVLLSQLTFLEKLRQVIDEAIFSLEDE